MKRGLFGMVAVLFAMLAPAPYVFADTVDTSTATASTCSPVAPAPTGITSPTGAWATTFTYNSCTGLWENPYYTWSPATQTASPKSPYVYTCDPTTWLWKTTVWTYSAAKDAFYPTIVSVSTLPSGALIAANSLDPCAPPPPVPASDPLSQNGSLTGGTSSSTSTLNGNTTVAIANQIGSVALSGNASVLGNTTAGSATSGNAMALANVLNAVASSSALSGGGVTTFVANINGDVQGNLIVDPSQLQPASNSDPLTNNNLTVNSQNSGQITNNINLSATSGNADVTHNTTAGNATTGNAAAIADIVNMLDSIISAGKSFVGVININGNMNGDILVPQSFLDSLIASNAPSTTVSLSQSQANSLGITTSNTLATTNNVTSSASSGDASVTHNTTAGNATTGNASTSVRVFNLTGSQVIGANCLLVFVNVSGTWVGVIMNAPAGATAAALGGGVTTGVTNGTINSSTNNAILNNIDLAAQSGDASVAGNTTAGNATSGNANTAANLLNLNDSQFNLSGWFGILFINIFGNWYGSFGAYTPPVTTSSGGGGTGPTPSNTSSDGPSRKVFRFVQTADTTAAPDDSSVVTASAHLASQAGNVLGAVNRNLNTTAQAAGDIHLQAVGGILLALGLVAIAAERIMSAREVKL